MVAMFSLDQDEIRSFRRGPQKHYLPQLTTNKSFGDEDFKSFSQSENKISHGGHVFQ